VTRQSKERLPKDSSNRIPIIDLIRFLSIFLVMGLHFFMSGVSSGYSYTFWGLISRTFANGAYGVTCFFVVSGFVITRMLVSQTRDFSKLDLKSFYVKRVARLFPLLAVILLVGLIILKLHPDTDTRMSLCFRSQNSRFGWDFWFSILSFTFNWLILFKHYDVGFHWGVLWSLAVEEQFYLFYPLLVKTLRRSDRVIVFLLGVVFSGILFRVGVHFWMPLNFLMSTVASFAVFDQIAIGALTYFLLLRVKVFFEKKWWAGYFFLFSGLFILITIYFETSIVDTGQLILAPTCLALGCALMILGGIHVKALYSPLWKILSWPGQLSYGGYLWHITVLFLLWPVFSTIGVTASFLYYLSVGILSYASYRWFEIPVNHWVRKALI
jgi:peptidoglycan/LPS O-acetylase OafA/YrhL